MVLFRDSAMVLPINENFVNYLAHDSWVKLPFGESKSRVPISNSLFSEMLWLMILALSTSRISPVQV